MFRSHVVALTLSAVAWWFAPGDALAQRPGTYVIVTENSAIVSGKEIAEPVSRGMALHVRGSRDGWYWVTRQANGWIPTAHVVPLPTALAYLSAEIAEQPNNATLRNERAMVHLETGNYAAAIQDYTAALRLAPQSAALRANRAVAQFENGDYAAAVRDLDQVVQLRPDDAQSYVDRGWARYHAEDYAGALADYEQALKLDENSGGAMANLAWLRATCPDASLRDGAEAQRLAEQVCAATENKDAFALGALAAALAEQGKLTEAAEKQQQAVERSPYTRRKLYRQRLAFYTAGQPYRLGQTEPALRDPAVQPATAEAPADEKDEPEDAASDKPVEDKPADEQNAPQDAAPKPADA